MYGKNKYYGCVYLIAVSCINLQTQMAYIQNKNKSDKSDDADWPLNFNPPVLQTRPQSYFRSLEGLEFQKAWRHSILDFFLCQVLISKILQWHILCQRAISALLPEKEITLNYKPSREYIPLVEGLFSWKVKLLIRTNNKLITHGWSMN